MTLLLRCVNRLEFVAMLAVGCSQASETSASVGARACAHSFFSAVIQQDWATAYAVIDPADQKRIDAERFGRLGKSYRSSLGFEPRTVQMQACEERGGEATAHVVILGRDAKRSHRYKEAVFLRRRDDAWRVILPASFGQGSARN
jgi:hypothetical protein